MLHPHDEFDIPRERQEKYPTIREYLRSRSSEQIVDLIADPVYQRNIYATYDGSTLEHARDIFAEIYKRGRFMGPPV